MNGRLAGRLRRRALAFLEEAREAADPVLAVFFAEQAMQLYIKYVLHRLFAETPREHGLRTLLGILYRGLVEAGYRDEAEAIASFVAEHRGLLVEAEEAYVLSRYSETEYSWDDAERMVGLTERPVEVLDWVVEKVVGGGG